MTNIEKKGYKPVKIKIYSKTNELILEDEVLCAYDTHTSKILDMGKAALSYVQDNNVVVVNPLKWGAVGDFIVFSKVMTHFIKQLPTSFGRKPKIAICVPAKVTDVEMKAFIEGIHNSIYFLEKSFDRFKLEGDAKIEKDVNYYVEFVSEYYASEYYG